MNYNKLTFAQIKYMSDKLSDNLNLLMANARLSASELARRTGVPESSIKKIRNRNHLNPTLSTLLPLAKYFSLTVSQLIGEEALPAKYIFLSANPKTELLFHVPILSWSEVFHWPETKNQAHASIMTEHKYSDLVYALIVEQNNLENLSEGTALLIDPLVKPEHHDLILLNNKEKKISLNYILFHDEKTYIKPLVIGEKIYMLTEEHILGVVMEYKKNLKQ